MARQTIPSNVLRPTPPGRAAGVVRPPWCDPRWVVATNEATPSPLTVNGATPVLVADNNPKRWGLWFCNRTAGVVAVSLQSAAAAGVFGMFQILANGDRLLNIFEFGPLVCYEWWANGGGAGPFWVTEIEIH